MRTGSAAVRQCTAMPGCVGPATPGRPVVRLYSYPASPNTRRIAIYLREKGIEPPWEEIVVDLTQGEQMTADFLRMNPAGKVPVLETDDGIHITQSLPIVEYLEELYPEPAMIGSSPSERARVRSLERFVDMEIMGTMGIMAQQRMPLYVDRFGDSEAVIAYARRRQLLALQQLEQMVAGNTFVAGDRPTIADCTLFAIYEFAFLVDSELTPEFPGLYQWHQRFSMRPSVQYRAVESDGMDRLKASEHPTQ